MARIRLAITGVFLAACCKLFGTNNIRIATANGAEVQQLLAVAHGNRECLIDVHATNRIAHKPSREIRSLRIAGPIRALWRRRSVLQQRAENSAKQPSAPRDNEEPKQKPDNARKESHGC
jgi:hypothetical protein